MEQTHSKGPPSPDCQAEPSDYVLIGPCSQPVINNRNTAVTCTDCVASSCTRPTDKNLQKNSTKVNKLNASDMFVQNYNFFSLTL